MAVGIGFAIIILFIVPLILFALNYERIISKFARPDKDDANLAGQSYAEWGTSDQSVETPVPLDNALTRRFTSSRLRHRQVLREHDAESAMPETTHQFP